MLRTAGRELSVRAEAWALGCVRDRSGYETLNQLRITNYELRILRVSESRAELVRAMPSGSKMFYEVKDQQCGANYDQQCEANYVELCKR